MCKTASTTRISDHHIRQCMWKILPHIALYNEDVQGWVNDLFFLKLFKEFHGKSDFSFQILGVIKTGFPGSTVYHTWTL